MTEKQCLVRCYNCNLDTEFKLQVLDTTTLANDQKIEKKVYCKYCNRLNLIHVPSSWDSHPLVLGVDDFLGYSKGIPIFQGKRA